MLLLQHPVLMLVFKQKLYVSLASWLGRLTSYFPVFQQQLLSQLLPQWGVGVLRFQRSALWPTSCPTLELGFRCVGLLGAFFCALPPFSGARSEIHQPAPCYQRVMLVCWLVFNFSTLFDFGCCSLAQEMNFVDHYLPYFRQWLITCLLSSLLPFMPLFMESLHRNQLLAPLIFPSALRASCPLFSSLFIIQFFGVFCCPGSYAGLSQGWLWEYYMLLICSPTGLHLPSRFGASIWWHGSPPVFSV
jgi:hypothetical protein